MNIGISNECGTPAIQLNNGIKMPQIGLGTFLIPKENLSRTIAQAYEMGYRQFDTAWRYHNEADIAKALKENGINRQDVFITTKVNVDALYFQNYKYGYHSIFNVRKAIQAGLPALLISRPHNINIDFEFRIDKLDYREIENMYNYEKCVLQI